MRAASEIDQTLRKIWDGLDEWDALWDKLEETEVIGGSLGAAGASERSRDPSAAAGTPSPEPAPPPRPAGCAQDASQRDKIAQQMKTDLKKLQRHREQVGAAAGECMGSTDRAGA